MVVRPRLFAAVLVAASLLATIALPVPAADAASSHVIRLGRGTIGGGQSALALAEASQTGTDDTWVDYVEFFPDEGKHRSIIKTFPTGDPSDSMTITWNYRGPHRDEMPWKLHVRNIETSEWEKIFDNKTVNPWVWTEDSATLDNAADYIDSRGRVRVRFQSANAADVGQLDLLIAEFDDGDDPDPDDPTPFPADSPFDYQIGEPYAAGASVGVVSRDWFDATPASGLYNICYVNAFQTQSDDSSVDRPDELSNWPANLVLSELGDDPEWGGEYLVDIRNASKRAAALEWLRPMVETCASKGYDAVEWDNLDSWTRFDGTPLEDDMPLSRYDAKQFATDLTGLAHSLGLFSAQKNTADLSASEVASIGFDFAVIEECGRYDECDVYQAVYGDAMVVIEYRDGDFDDACAVVGDSVSVVRRDRNVTAPGSNTYVYDEC